MAATQKEKNGVLTLTAFDADWYYKDSKPEGWPDHPRLLSIKFYPGAANDELFIYEEQDADVDCFYAKCENTYDQRVEYYHGARALPFIDYTNSTLSSGHKVVIKLWREA